MFLVFIPYYLYKNFLTLYLFKLKRFQFYKNIFIFYNITNNKKKRKFAIHPQLNTIGITPKYLYITPKIYQHHTLILNLSMYNVYFKVCSTKANQYEEGILNWNLYPQIPKNQTYIYFYTHITIDFFQIKIPVSKPHYFKIIVSNHFNFLKFATIPLWVRYVNPQIEYIYLYLLYSNKKISKYWQYIFLYRHFYNLLVFKYVL